MSVKTTTSSSPATRGNSGAAPEFPGWKRSLDLVCCLIALPALILCTLVVQVLVSIFSPGPVLFLQERIGYGGRRFKLYKFRTMHRCSAPAQHETHVAALMNSGAPMQKLDGKGDARIFPGGWLLRATGLDELPQIINVLRGEMSMVGPRPCLPYEYERFSHSQRRRTHTLPGLTGLWQVSGKNRTTFHEMIRLDLAYTEKKSLWLDVKIILGTLPAILRQVSDTRRQRKRVVDLSTSPGIDSTETGKS